MIRFLPALVLLSLPFSAHAELKLVSKGKKTNFLYEKDPKALVSSVNFIFRVGSLADPKGKEGLASLSFESLLRGTTKIARKDFFAATERLGASLNVDTDSDRTILSLSAVSDNLPAAIDLMAEAIQRPGLKDAEIKSLAEEQMAQLHQALANNRSMMKRVFRQALYQGTGLAFPPSGTIEGVKAINPQDVRNFLAERIKSGNVVVAVDSNRAEKDVKAWIEKSFADFPDGKGPKILEPAPKKIVGRTLFVVDRKGSSTTEVAIGHLGIASDNPDRELLETGLSIFGGDSMSSRLFDTLRGKNGWTYGAYAGFQMLGNPRRAGSGFMIYTFPSAEFTEPAVLKALEMYADYAKNEVTAKELDFAKKLETNSYPFKYATSFARLSARVANFLDGTPLLTVPEFRRTVNGFNAGEILRAVKKVHDPENLVIVVVGDPAKTESLKKSIPNLTSVKIITDPMIAF